MIVSIPMISFDKFSGTRYIVSSFIVLPFQMLQGWALFILIYLFIFGSRQIKKYETEIDC